MNLTVKNRISFWFGPNEKPTTVHISGEVTNDTIKSAYSKVALTRYPTLFRIDQEPNMFSYPIINRPSRQHVGDPAGINAWYTIQPVLEWDGRYFELKEI